MHHKEMLWENYTQLCLPSGFSNLAFMLLILFCLSILCSLGHYDTVVVVRVGRCKGCLHRVRFDVVALYHGSIGLMHQYKLASWYHCPSHSGLRSLIPGFKMAGSSYSWSEVCCFKLGTSCILNDQSLYSKKVPSLIPLWALVSFHSSTTMQVEISKCPWLCLIYNLVSWLLF